MLTLVAADVDLGELPGQRAELLVSALRQSVRRWERPAKQAEVAPTDAQLMDGFAAIGQALTEDPSLAAVDALASVAQTLQDRWQQSRAAAAELGEQILEFWDDRVGVFVRQNMTITARSRVVADLVSRVVSDFWIIG